MLLLAREVGLLLIFSPQPFAWPGRRDGLTWCKQSVAMTDNKTELEAAAFRRLLQHLNNKRTDVQNIDLMILAGFCRNCLADWYRDAAEARGVAMTRDEAREHVYGEPFAQWKARHQKDATAEQLAAFEATRKRGDA